MRNRLLILILIVLSSYDLLLSQNKIENKLLEVTFSGSCKNLWEYKIKSNGASLKIKPPVFEINGTAMECSVDKFKQLTEPVVLNNGVSEFIFQGKVKADPELNLKVIFRLSSDNAVLRFRYVISGSKEFKLTKSTGNDNIVYLATSTANFNRVKELQFSNYDEKFHSYMLKEQSVEDRFFDNNSMVMGPMLVLGNKDNSFLMAYEHGSQYCNDFLHFDLFKDRSLSISAV